METKTIDQRRAFVESYESGQWSMSELCTRYGISRPTGYTWLTRWRTEGAEGLADRSCVPLTSPARTDAAIVEAVIAARREHGWGATKLLGVLRAREPARAWPTRSTVNALLARRGLLRKQRRTRRWPHAGAAPLATTAANEVWPADFKGQFKTGDGIYCYPLTVTDHFSRAVLLCRALPSTQTPGVRAAFRTLFRQVGLPTAIRTDNGAPFASSGLHGLSALNVWWMQLGIVHQRIRPGYPQGNGTHERMHRELKRETAVPPAASARAQQRRFDAFQQRYNKERPHEALGNRRPGTLWRPSRRVYPERIAPPEYDAHLEVRRIRRGGELRFRGQYVFVSHLLAGANVGLEEVVDGVWNVIYYGTVLGRFDARTGTMTAG
jgi:transposase InsO family protein